MSERLKRNRLKVLATIHKLGPGCSIREVAENMDGDCTTGSGVWPHIARLEALGLLKERVPNQARSLVVSEKGIEVLKQMTA